MSLKFATIASSSSGNSVYIGTEKTKILIDAGLSGKKIQEGLKNIDVDCKDIDAIFVTHEHIDHVKGIGVLSRRFEIPIYATSGTWMSMPESVGCIKDKNRKYVYSSKKCIINDICLCPFSIPHDANEPVGYSIYDGKRKICVATDMGHVTKEVLSHLEDSNFLLLESNHDVNMLKNGSYPYNIKQRILGKNGHLSNETAGKLAAYLIKQSRNLKGIFFGHLSMENNTPSKAYKTVENILNSENIKIGHDAIVYITPGSHVSKVVKFI